MADKMEFPKTMKEFIKGYSFKDSDEVYTNGSMLIQTYRVEQAIEHYQQEIRAQAIDEFVKKVKSNAGGGLISNWDKPYGISYERIEEIAAQMKGEE